MTIYHKHHIVPRYMGGSDDPSNIVELTIEEHAEAHRLLYEKYGMIEDKLAWQGLCGLIPKADIMSELHKLGRKKTDTLLLEKYGVTNPSQIPHVREKHKKISNRDTRKERCLLHQIGQVKLIKRRPNAR